MPRTVKKDGRSKSKPWAIVDGGRIVGRSTTKAKANRSAGIANAKSRRKRKSR